MEPENDGFQKESPFPGVDFRVQPLNFRGVHGFENMLLHEQSTSLGELSKRKKTTRTQNNKNIPKS